MNNRTDDLKALAMSSITLLPPKAVYKVEITISVYAETVHMSEHRSEAMEHSQLGDFTTALLNDLDHIQSIDSVTERDQGNRRITIVGVRGNR